MVQPVSGGTLAHTCPEGWLITSEEGKEMSGYSVSEQFERIDDVLRKNYALTELLAQTFSAFVVGSNNKEVIANFIKSTSVSDPSMVEAHTHAKEALLKILDSVKTN
ncbi:TPA: hypothetical protein NBO33_002494 [Enterobacter hormaechei]|nr:hypothetical protein [Enterobacter hormaechei]HAS1322741.1 hypothetical protein [Enterobacter hormaechei]HAS1351768.1 hypothetical protein [Enterobacter hormaechei]HAS1376705.1 hypothetical protein [Enterobacter hormaechei]HAS1382165.1 hypothetical protein [Enterobacter hormaechei]